MKSPADDGVRHQVQIPRKRKSFPNYISEETEAEWCKTGQQLVDFRNACIGYSVYMEKKGVSGDQRNKQPDLPFCVGMEVLLDKRLWNQLQPILMSMPIRLKGLDVVGVQTVINNACPRDLSCYVHRVGWTARAGRGECAVGREGTVKSRNGGQRPQRLLMNRKIFLVKRDASWKQKEKCCKKKMKLAVEEKEAAGKSKNESSGISLVDVAYRRAKSAKAAMRAGFGEKSNKKSTDRPRKPKPSSKTDEMGDLFQDDMSEKKQKRVARGTGAKKSKSSFNSKSRYKQR
ncbi:hypothetical protein QQ045_015270 [Rhodiola kirilowii]